MSCAHADKQMTTHATAMKAGAMSPAVGTSLRLALIPTAVVEMTIFKNLSKVWPSCLDLNQHMRRVNFFAAPWQRIAKASLKTE
jgi:hypothetical protein